MSREVIHDQTVIVTVYKVVEDGNVIDTQQGRSVIQKHTPEEYLRVHGEHEQARAQLRAGVEPAVEEPAANGTKRKPRGRSRKQEPDSAGDAPASQPEKMHAVN